MEEGKYQIIFVGGAPRPEKACPFTKLENMVSQAINEGFVPYGELMVKYNQDMDALMEGFAPIELIQVVVKKEVLNA